MFRLKSYVAGVFVLLMWQGLVAQEKPRLDVATIMQDPKTWVGSSPRRAYWSEDSRWIYFYWNPEAADSDSLYKVSARGGEPVKLSREERLRVPPAGGVYTRDYRYKVFVRNGDVYVYDARRDALRRVTNTSDRESNARFSHDERAVLFQRGMNLFRWDRRTGALTQLTDFRKGRDPKKKKPKSDAERFVEHEELQLIQVVRERKERRERAQEAREAENPEAPPRIYVGDNSVQNLMLSPDERFVTLRLAGPQRGKRTIVPNYVTESAFTEELNARPKVGSPQRTTKFAFVDLERDTLIYVKTDSLPGIFDPPEFTRVPAPGDTAKSRKRQKKEARAVLIHGPYWSTDGKQAFVVVRALDNKDRWLALLDLPSDQLVPFEHQHDDAWIGGPNIGGWTFAAGAVGWMPDNRRVWFCSEESGYSHLYTVNPRTGAREALTQGTFEIYGPKISRDKKYWYFAANDVHPGERHFYRMPVNGGERQRLTHLPGRNDVVVSPDGKKLAILRSYMNQPPELYVQDARPNARARQLTHSTTKAWRAYPWREPEVVQFTARDGARPYARLYRPENPNGAAVIFVHGAGYLQNAHKWWSSYFREYMFHNLLADRGYTVLDIDYRGSAGYGRDWRTAIYRHMGGKDLDDQVDGARWLVEAFNIDPKRIGIYGGSYGGFITFMAMFTTPDVFAAGAALRPVTDWAHYNHAYTSNILNIPQADTVAYRRSSPIYHAEGLKGHLLICHGMIDTNVHFQDTVRLVQRLIELGKENWEVAIYPLEGHGFREPSSWTDEYRRILKLFERTLKP